jgi:glycosyltransferase involved in cell wall biosynthesis
LVFAGDGPLRAALESEAHSLRVFDRVRFLGFVNQSGLPETYTASDIFVLPSESEPFGVVVNEAMLCRCAVVVTDHVGAGFDLVRAGKTGFVFPAGNVSDLAAVLRRVMSDRQLLREMGEEARARMSQWSPADNIAGFKESIRRAIGSRSHSPAVAETR